MKEGKEKFIRDRKEEFGPVIAPEVAAALREGRDLTSEQVSESIERIETKVFTLEKKEAHPGAKRVLLEASEPAAYRTVKPLIAFLQQDERCAALTLVTDNVAGKNFVDEHEALGLTQKREPSQPVLADIAGPFDSVLVLVEPGDSPDRPLLYSGKSVYGNDTTKLLYMIDGILGENMRSKFSDEAVAHMDRIDIIGTATEFSKELLIAIAPQLRDRVVVAGSLLLQAFKQDIEKQHLFTEEERVEGRHLVRETLGVSEDAVMVLYSGFPSIDYVTHGAKAGTNLGEGEKTLNQETFDRTLESVRAAALAELGKKFALVIRTHPRAAGVDNDLRVPDDLPQNLRVVWGNGPTFSYDAIAGAADVVACQSTSTEVLYAPYRGVVAAVSGYAGPGRQQEINEKIFGPGLTTFEKSHDVLYVDSVETFTTYLKDFRDRPPRRPIPDNPIPRIVNLLLGA